MLSTCRARYQVGERARPDAEEGAAAPRNRMRPELWQIGLKRMPECIGKQKGNGNMIDRLRIGPPFEQGAAALGEQQTDADGFRSFWAGFCRPGRLTTHTEQMASTALTPTPTTLRHVMLASAGPGTLRASLTNLGIHFIQVTTIGCGQERFGSGPLIIHFECLATLHCLLHKARPGTQPTHRGYWSEVHPDFF